ncbi:MAG: hypothetical protein EAX81_08080 [Candidatus Thorarchaeota archaeon]|nr:hypothetical protein [Candidatus Thorarchaeota archaeon]
MLVDMPDTLREIVLTPAGKQPMKEVMFITDPDSGLAFDHKARIAILTILARGVPDTSTTVEYDQATDVTTETRRKTVRYALSVIEIMKMSNEYEGFKKLTRNQIYHHLQVMIDSGVIVKHGTVQNGNRFTDYYRRTAKNFVLTLETPSYGAEFLKDHESKRLEGLLSMFAFKLNRSQKEKLLELRIKTQKLQDKWRPMIAKLTQDDVADQEVICFYHWLVDVYSLTCPEYIELGRNVAAILFPHSLEDQKC